MLLYTDFLAPLAQSDWKILKREVRCSACSLAMVRSDDCRTVPRCDRMHLLQETGPWQLFKDIQHLHFWSQAFRRIGGPLAEAHSEDLAKRLQDWSERIVYESYNPAIHLGASFHTQFFFALGASLVLFAAVSSLWNPRWLCGRLQRNMTIACIVPWWTPWAPWGKWQHLTLPSWKRAWRRSGNQFRVWGVQFDRWICRCQKWKWDKAPYEHWEE